MHTQLIEAENGFNWGKFMLCRFTDEWGWRSAVDNLNIPILASRGWSPEHLLIVDLQTGEGAVFLPGGLACADLNKKAVWVCPMFQPFLEWLYTQDLHDLRTLPAVVKLGPEHSAMRGWRREGPEPASVEVKSGDDPLAVARQLVAAMRRMGMAVEVSEDEGLTVRVAPVGST